MQASAGIRSSVLSQALGLSHALLLFFEREGFAEERYHGEIMDSAFVYVTYTKFGHIHRHIHNSISSIFAHFRPINDDFGCFSSFFHDSIILVYVCMLNPIFSIF